MTEIRNTLARMLKAGLGSGHTGGVITTTLAETQRAPGERPDYSVMLGLRRAPEPSPRPADAPPDVDALIAESRKLLGDKADEVLTPADLAAIKADPEVAKRFAKTLSSFREETSKRREAAVAAFKQEQAAAEQAERARLANLGGALARAERDQ